MRMPALLGALVAAAAMAAVAFLSSGASAQVDETVAVAAHVAPCFEC